MSNEKLYHKIIEDLSPQELHYFNRHLGYVLEDLREQLEQKVSDIENTIDSFMGNYGDTSSDCQRMAMINKLWGFSKCINGITREDLHPRVMGVALKEAIQEYEDDQNDRKIISPRMG